MDDVLVAKTYVLSWWMHFLWSVELQLLLYFHIGITIVLYHIVQMFTV